MSLSKAKIDAAKPKTRPYKMGDEKGLFLHVQPSGSKWWRFRYRWHGKERLLSLGVYPDTSLASARSKREEARRQLADGVDPSAVRKAERLAHDDSFRSVAEEWFPKQQRAASTEVRDRRILDHLLKAMGTDANAGVSVLKPDQVLSALRKLEDRPETARRACGMASSIFQYAIHSQRATYDPAANLGKALKSPETVNRAALTDPKDVGRLLVAIGSYHGQPATVACLKLAALTFLRPGELRMGLWSEIDFEKAQWNVPASRMKMGRAHIVPLATRALAVLKGLKQHTGHQPLIFQSLRPARPLSENTLNTALRTLGYSGNQMSAHGFRAMASTLLHELEFPPEVIETQLAHVRSGVAGVYNRSHLLKQRRAMMQAWADHLDELMEAVNAKED